MPPCSHCHLRLCNKHACHYMVQMLVALANLILLSFWLQKWEGLRTPLRVYYTPNGLLLCRHSSCHAGASIISIPVVVRASIIQRTICIRAGEVIPMHLVASCATINLDAGSRRQ